MKKSLRLALALAVVLSVGTMPVFATVSGGNPPPGSLNGTSSLSVAIDITLSVFGL